MVSSWLKRRRRVKKLRYQLTAAEKRFARDMLAEARKAHPEANRVTPGLGQAGLGGDTEADYGASLDCFLANPDLWENTSKILDECEKRWIN